MTERTPMPVEPVLPPAFYAKSGLRTRSAAKDWWTLLHPPYTLWHLSYVVIGACLVGPVDVVNVVATVLAFFLAVGVAAHALDELNGRPLRTDIPTWALVAASAGGISGAVVLGVIGISRVGAGLVVFIVVGVVLAIGYNLELWNGRLHTDTMFAASWGAFPLLTGYFAQHDALSATAVVGAFFAFYLSLAQRRLSTPARALRRKTRQVEGTIVASDGTVVDITRATLLGPIEGALRALVWSTVTLAAALALSRLQPWP